MTDDVAKLKKIVSNQDKHIRSLIKTTTQLKREIERLKITSDSIQSILKRS